MNTTWFKFPVSFFAEARTLKLRREIGDPAFWVPVRLWAFAASQDGSGNLSGYTPEEIADAIRYTGDAHKLMTALTPDFLDKKRRIVGWDELFALAASRKLSAQKAARFRWDQPRSTPPDPRSDQKTGEERREEESRESESRGECDALRDGVRDASFTSEGTPSKKGPLTHTPPVVLSEEGQASICKEARITPEGIIKALGEFNATKALYEPDRQQTAEGFRIWLKTSKIGTAYRKQHFDSRHGPMSGERVVKPFPADDSDPTWQSDRAKLRIMR